MIPLDGDTFRGPDPRPSKRKKDPAVMKTKHERGCVCVLNCGKVGEAHHIVFKSSGGPDAAWNLVCLCQEHHALVHSEDECTKIALGDHILLERKDTIMGVGEMMGAEKGKEWLRRRLHIQ